MLRKITKTCQQISHSHLRFVLVQNKLGWAGQHRPDHDHDHDHGHDHDHDPGHSHDTKWIEKKERKVFVIIKEYLCRKKYMASWFYFFCLSIC